MKQLLEVPVEISARHVHLDVANLEALFGHGAKLTLKRDLSQPGQFAANESVTLQTPKGIIERVRILGPLRSYCQVELSRTDALQLGLDPPVRRSHEIDLDGTPGVTMVGPEGRIRLEKGVILPWRHLHISNTEALELNLQPNTFVSVKVHGERAVIFENVLVHMHPSFHLACHLDTDEGNAAGVTLHMRGEVLR